MTRGSTAKALAASRCPICLDAVEHPASLSVCGHVFCKPCIKAALHAKKVCPVCRTEATHRKIVDVLQETAVDGGSSSTSGRCLEARPGADAPIPDGAWSCQSCTMANSEAASRCATCHARRPSEYKGKTPEKPQRYRIVPHRPARRQKRVKRADAASPRPFQEDEEDEEDGDTAGDEEVTEPQVVSTAPQSSRTQALLCGARENRKKVRRQLSLEALSPQLRRLEARVVADSSPGGAAASAAPSGATPSRDGCPLVRSLWHSKSGYKNVSHNRTQRAAKKPWQARNDDGTSLGMYATPEEAALAYSKALGHDVATRLAMAVGQERARMTSEEALRAAEREGLTLKRTQSNASTPYVGVYKMGDGPRCYLAKVHREGQRTSLGSFGVMEQAALEIARFYHRHGPTPRRGHAEDSE